ncbi:hypothetical protein VE02_03528 [Pseudogymnoascus sp. 03VT05]|nr:hypothetical protein VE02_03528 [Pseudogymnoascus sp. 03VT05]
MSQAPFPSASLITEGLLEQRLKTKKISDAATDNESIQDDVKPEPDVNVHPSLLLSQTETIPIKETPPTGAADTSDDTGPAPLDITSEAKLPELSKSTDSGTPKAIDIPRPSHKSNEWATIDSDSTDDKTLNWLEKEIAKQDLGKDTTTFERASALKQKHGTWPLLPGEKERSPRKYIYSEPGRNVVVHRGFGDFARPRSAALDETRTSFPPLSNESYHLTTYGLDPKAPKVSRRIVLGKNKALVAPIDPTGADGEPHTLDGNISGPSSVYSNSLVTESFVPSEAATGSVFLKGNLEFCTKCQKRHIKPGTLETLDARDTCCSMLPDWFPKERYEKPWEAFTDLINKYVRASQMLEGDEANPETKVPWNKEYHDPSPEWKEVGRFGGWWKCRIEDEEGEEGESDVPAIERNCRLCHKRKAEDDRLAAKKVETLADKKQSIEDWINKHMKQEMVKDRAYVKARLATEGF